MYVIIRKLSQGKDAKALVMTVKEAMEEFKVKGVLRTITTDNGSEFARHKEITGELGVPVYFAHPYAPYEKRVVENTNGLIRQYIPKGADFNEYTGE